MEDFLEDFFRQKVKICHTGPNKKETNDIKRSHRLKLKLLMTVCGNIFFDSSLVYKFLHIGISYYVLFQIKKRDYKVQLSAELACYNLFSL